MRGCLFVLVFAALVLTVAAWFGAPIVASGLITTALHNAGYQAATSTVRATADPPPKLLLGRADRVQIDGTDVDFGTFHAASLELVLSDVDVVARTAGRISGRILGAELKTNDGAAAAADVEVDGVADAAVATILVDPATVDRVVKAAFLKKFGVAVSSTELVAPNILRISATGLTVEGSLIVDADGAIAVSTPLGATPVVRFDPAFPLVLRSVSAEDGKLRVEGTLDAEALIGG